MFWQVASAEAERRLADVDVFRRAMVDLCDEERRLIPVKFPKSLERALADAEASPEDPVLLERVRRDFARRGGIDLLPGNWTAVSWKIPVLTDGQEEHGGMKRSKFSSGQIAYILRQAEEGTAIGEVCRKAGISEATFYVWRKKYAGLMPSEMKRLK